MKMVSTRSEKRPPALDATLFAALADSSRHGIVILEDGKVTYANARLAEMAGRSLQEVRKWNIKNFLRWLHADDRAIAQEQYRTPPVQEPASTRHEFRYVDKKGEMRWLEATGAMVVRDGVTVLQATLTDITDRKAMEQALRESEEKYRALVEPSLQGMVLVQGNRIVYANQAAASVLDLPRQDVLSWGLSDWIALVHPEDRALVTDRLRGRLGGKPEPDQYEVRIVRPSDRSLRWVEVHASLVQWGGGSAVQVLFLDVTDRKRAEEQVSESEEKYRALVEQSLEGLVIIQDNRIVFANRALVEISGYPLEEILALTPEQMWASLHPDDRAMVLSRLQERLAGKPVPSRYAVRVQRKDGSMYWADLSVTLIEYGGKPAIQATYMDVTERMLAEAALRESEGRYRLLYENLADGVFLTDDKGNITLCNARGAEMFGYTPNQLLGVNFGKLVHPDDRERMMRGFAAGVRTGRTAPSGLEAKALRKDGSSFFYHVTSKLLVENGHAHGMQALIRDVTERKLAAEKIEEARNRAEFFNDLMAHDLNNINQGILSALELALYDMELPAKSRQQIQVAFDQVMRSADLIGRVKKIARLEVELPQLTVRDVAPTFLSAVEAAKSSTPAKTLKLTTNIREGAFSVLADEFLSDLFFNLLHNAMKFDRSSQVAIDVKASQDSKKQVLKIEFKDHGPGIPDEAKQRIFARLTSRREQRTRTSGIGLTLARGIVERYNGQIWVEDRVAGDASRGSNFVVLLPVTGEGNPPRLGR
jgi:PAS domain S-box-containing protein